VRVRHIGSLLTVALLLSACGGASAATTTTSGLQASTTTTPITTVPPSTTGSALPTVPVDQASAAFDAWSSGDMERLAALTGDVAYEVLSTRLPSEDDGWGAPSCEGAAGSTYCSWTGVGERLVLRVANEAASRGEPAVIEATFEPLG
jgi:hypothetical protein